MSSQKLQLLYIAGFSRCGSTILSNVLGEIPGLMNAGELMYIWDQMTLPHGICGCGTHVTRCEIWRQVLVEAFGPDVNVDSQAMIQLRDSHWQSRKVPVWLSLASARRRLRAEMDSYLRNLERLYAAIQQVLPGRIIIDSSKNPFYLYMLSMLPNVDIAVVHIVRDPRANAFSWLSHKDGFASQSVWRSSLSWDARNYVLALLARQFRGRHLTLKYEDFVAEPKRWLHAIAGLIGHPQTDFPFVTEAGLELGPNHCVYGNPDLFRKGPIKLRLDDRWKAMRKRDRYITTALTWPLMSRFGYSFQP
jgi:Sulfotransferase family